MYIIPSFPEGSAPRYGASQWRNSRPPPAAQKAPCRGIRKWLNPNAGEIAPPVARPVYLSKRSLGSGKLAQVLAKSAFGSVSARTLILQEL
jgi:hypothetical protein